MKVIGIIPARFDSTRFPGKPLCSINGISMIERVYKQAQKSEKLSKVLVATDDERIYNHVTGFGGHVILTSPSHQSGTNRCYEAVNKFEKLTNEMFDVVINIQGDEPLVNPADIDLLAKSFTKPMIQIVTLRKKITNFNELISPNVVKVVTSQNDKALYFSRQTIPHVALTDEKKWLKNATFFKHIGIYAYRTDVLRQIAYFKTSFLETVEKLEQLRWLDNGIPVLALETNSESFAVDVPEDVLKIEKLLNKGI